MRKIKKTAVWFYPEIDDVDAKQYHRASFSTRNSALNTSLCKPIRMQDFIQLCDSDFNQITKRNMTRFKTIQLEAVKKQTIPKNNN